MTATTDGLALLITSTRFFSARATFWCSPCAGSGPVRAARASTGPIHFAIGESSALLGDPGVAEREADAQPAQLVLGPEDDLQFLHVLDVELHLADGLGRLLGL